MPDGETPSLRNLASFGDVAEEDDASLIILLQLMQ